MLDLLAMAKALSMVASVTPTDALSKALLPCVDATRLVEDDEIQPVSQFVDAVRTLPIASVCLYPCYIAQIKPLLAGTPIHLGSVANFPLGNSHVDTIIAEVKELIALGCDEIDVVLPYQAYLNGDKSQAIDVIAACKQACGKDTLLKVIVESGAFESLDSLYQACQEIIALDVDFLKTSSGKHTIGATMDAAFTMLSAIKDSNKPCGFKVSGGIKNVTQACQYYSLTKSVLNIDHLDSKNFRIGSSQLIAELSTV